MGGARVAITTATTIVIMIIIITTIIIITLILIMQQHITLIFGNIDIEEIQIKLRGTGNFLLKTLSLT